MNCYDQAYYADSMITELHPHLEVDRLTLRAHITPHLEVSVDDAQAVAVADALQDLLDAVAA